MAQDRLRRAKSGSNGIRRHLSRLWRHRASVRGDGGAGRPNRTLPGSCAVRAMAAGTNCHPSTPFCPPSACAVQARSFVSNGLITRGHGGLRDVTALVDREHFHHFPNLFGGMRGYSDRIFEYNRVCSPGFESAAMFAERAAQQPVFQADR